MNITIDYREQRSGIVELANKLPDIVVTLKTLKIGDYLVDDRIVFERKTLHDFTASISNGRFFRQSYCVADRTTPYILILEGSNTDLNRIQIKRMAIQGALLHISLFLGIPILRSQSISETLELMRMASLQLQKHNNTTGLRIYKHNTKPKGYSTNRTKLQLLQSLPGVGHKRAKAILNEYGTLSNVFATDAERLQQIDGIGLQTASRIVRLLNT